jgi:hypothetical protein
MRYEYGVYCCMFRRRCSCTDLAFSKAQIPVDLYISKQILHDTEGQCICAKLRLAFWYTPLLRGHDILGPFASATIVDFHSHLHSHDASQPS